MMRRARNEVYIVAACYALHSKMAYFSTVKNR